MECVPLPTGDRYDVPEDREKTVDASAGQVEVREDGNCFYYSIIQACYAYREAHPRVWERIEERLARWANRHDIELPELRADPTEADSTAWRSLIAKHFRDNLQLFTGDPVSVAQLRANYEFWQKQPCFQQRVAIEERVSAEEDALPKEAVTGELRTFVKYAIANISVNKAFASGIEKEARTVASNAAVLRISTCPIAPLPPDRWWPIFCTQFCTRGRKQRVRGPGGSPASRR